MGRTRPWTRRRMLHICILSTLLAASCASYVKDEVSYVSETPGSERQWYIYLSGTTGQGTARALLPNSQQSLAAIWSPDGEKVITYYPDEAEYYVVDFLQKGQVCLTCGLESYEDPAWAPQGDQLAIPTRDALYLAAMDGSTRIHLASVTYPSRLSWSPDGQRLVFAANGGTGSIFRLDIADGNLANLSRGHEGEWFAPRWSPTENKIAFVSMTDKGYFIQVMNAEGSDVTPIARWDYGGEIFDPGLWDPPQWSPDGKKLAFASASPLKDLDIFIVNADGNGLVNLTNMPLATDYSPVWSPDGQQIAFVSNRDGNPEIYVMNADGGNLVNVSNNAATWDRAPSWRPRR